MLPMYLQRKCLSHYFLSIVVTIGFSVPSYAQSNTQPDVLTVTPLNNITSLSAQSMLMSIAQQIPNLMQMTTAIAYVMGMFFIVFGVMKLKHFGESRTMMSHDRKLTEPLSYLVVGAMLLYLPSAVQIGMSTFWTNPNPYGYLQQQDQWGQFINVCFLIVQLIGTISFIRGLVMLSRLGGHGGQGGFKGGLTHIIAGIFCINIYQFVQVVLVTLGIQTS